MSSEEEDRDDLGESIEWLFVGDDVVEDGSISSS